MGIGAMVMAPNVGGFGAQEFLKLHDPELMLTCVRIYNDWQTEWASAESRRLFPNRYTRPTQSKKAPRLRRTKPAGNYEIVSTDCSPQSGRERRRPKPW